MKNVRSLLFPLIILALPLVAAAQQLVPKAQGVSDVEFYTLCKFGELIQNIINYAVLLSIPLVAVLVGYAGFLYFTSGANPSNVAKAKSIFATAFIGFLVAISGWLIINTILHALISPSYMSSGSWFRVECVGGRLLNKSPSDFLSSAPPSGFQINQPYDTYGDTPGTLTQDGFQIDQPYDTYGEAPVASCGEGYALVGDKCYDNFGDVQEPTYNYSKTNDPYDPYGLSEQRTATCGEGYALVGDKCYDNFGDVKDPTYSLPSKEDNGDAICGATGYYYYQETGNCYNPDTNQSKEAKYSTTNTSICNNGYEPQQSETEYWCQNPNNPDDWQVANQYLKGDEYYVPDLKGTERWGAQLEEACAKSGLNDCAVARAIMANECGSGNPNCLSRAGAAGLMQLMPQTACGIDSSIQGCAERDYAAVSRALRNDPQLNMEVGTKELARLYVKYDGDVARIAAAYNGGDKANNYSNVCGRGYAWQCEANFGYRETRNYVPKVVAVYNRLR